MPLLLSFAMLLWLSAQAAWMERISTQRYREAEARTLAAELLVAAERQHQHEIPASACGADPQTACGTVVAAVGGMASVVPGQSRLVEGVRSYRGNDGRVVSELMARRFGFDGRTLNSRAVGRALHEVSGGDPRVGLLDAGVLVNPLGVRGVDAPPGMFSSGSVAAQSR